jgi:poly(A) polymerase
MDFLTDQSLPDDEPVGALPPQPWLIAPETAMVMQALSADGAAPRFVGGCIRDALAHRAVTDIDIATPDHPELAMALLRRAGLKVIPTGITYGTITALAGDMRFEITTLRQDIETDGRHARVQYTDDWITDASRRDFTINALSARPDGMIFDPFGGINDLAEGRILFVGDPMTRINEDFLRILRFFRFFAHFGRPPADIPALNACRAAAPSLKELSGERVATELFKLLSAIDPLPALLLMQGTGVLAAILPEARNFGRLRVLIFLESRALIRPSIQPDPLRRLAALLEGDGEDCRKVAKRLRLSNAESVRLVELGAPRRIPDRLMTPTDLRRLLYQMGVDLFRDLTMLSWAGVRAQEGYLPSGDTARWMVLLDLADSWSPPVLPIDGKDVLDLGVMSGPEVGKYLAAVEEFWTAADFRPDRRALLAELARLVQSEPL